MAASRARAILALISLITAGATAQLSGPYTVGPAGNYATLTLALADLQANGVAGPVQFSVQANQTGPWVLNAFTGQGAANPVVINGSGAITLSGSLPLITLNGCSHVTFDGFSAAMALGTGVVIQGATSNCVFHACSFSMPVTGSGSTNTVYSATGGTSCRIEDSTFGGGYEAFNFGACDSFTVQRCRIQGGGFWVCEVTATNLTFKNNFVWGTSNYGFRAGLGSANLKIHNNSFHIVHPTAGGQFCSLRWYSASPSEVFNNAFHEVQVATNGYVMWCSGALKPTVMANNAYHIVNGLGVVYWSAASYQLAAWQGAGNDASSIQADPLFTNLVSTPPDLHLQNGSPCEGAGMTIATVTDDIDGTPRIQPYDIGAHEKSAFNNLSLLTGGGGLGDLTLSLTMIDPSAVEGLMLLSSYTLLSVGSGPVFGLWPDGLTWAFINTPLGPGNPLHFPLVPAFVFPYVPLAAPPGTLSILAGQVWDVVAVMLGPGTTYVGQSNIVRVAW
jgi:hypothetical protein